MGYGILTRLPYGHQRWWAWPFHLLQPQHNNNAQGGQSRASVATINTKDSSIASAQHGGVQNGGHVQPQLHGTDLQLKLQPHKEAPELFQRLRLLKNTHYTSEGIIDESTKKAAVVDPVEPKKVLKAAQEHGGSIKLILTTRHYCNEFMNGTASGNMVVHKEVLRVIQTFKAREVCQVSLTISASQYLFVSFKMVSNDIHNSVLSFFGTYMLMHVFSCSSSNSPFYFFFFPLLSLQVANMTESVELPTSLNILPFRNKVLLLSAIIRIRCTSPNRYL
ncbi:hypothetical protein DVH24_027697 [Malus domestica]|uniref:Uncharacterized protein n=1 Tax=Malus domestica TaxID=3750 RepID=A0A498H9Q8_MALDO|nr:hypothetical protein DVH24_027697 [Malus domestica]